MNSRLHPKPVDLRGQGLIEYALILVLGFLVVLASFRLLGVDTQALYEKITGMLDAQEKTYLTDNFLDLNARKVFLWANLFKS